MRKTLYFMTLFALVAVAAMSVFFNNTVSAQSGATVSRGRQATVEMLGRALDFRTGSDIAVFANKGISDNGSSRITGNVAAVEGANVKGLNRGNVQGSMLRREEGFDTNQAQMDLSSSFSILRNLPATLVADSNLSGKTFKAGVYSLASARLDGDMVLDANNDPNSIFVFKVSSALSTGRGSRVVLANGAYAANVFFVVEDTATVSEGTDFNGSIFAGNNVTVNSAKVTGRAVSVNGTVSLNAAEVVQQTGFLEICKVADANSGALVGRVFTFTAGGQTFRTVAGATGAALNCSAPQVVASGPLTVTESANTTNTAGGAAQTGGFQIVSVVGGAQSQGVVTSTNIPAGTAVVNVGAAATVQGETQITVTNRVAITGTIEICKVAAAGDTDALAQLGTLFSFTIDGINDANGTPVIFQAPLGTIANPGCTGPLSVLLPPDIAGGTETRAAGPSLDSAVTDNKPSGVNSPTATAPNLDTAASFAVLAGSTVTNTGNTVVSGNLGVSPGTATPGFPPGIVVNGVINAGNAVAAQAQSNARVAFDNLAGQPCDRNLSGQDLGGLTLTAGVNCFDSSAFLTGTLTLDAQGDPNAVFIFKIGSTLITASNSSVVVINGGTGCNVFFQVGSFATLGTGTQFTGNILALTSITLNTGANITAGRALALNGAVTLDTNNVDSSQCTNPQPTPTPTPVTPTPTPVTPTPTPVTPTPTITPTPTVTPTVTPTPTSTATTRATVVVRELPRPGFIFVTATAAGNGGVIVGTPQVITTGVNAGGGFFQVTINANSNAANQTLVTVTNRSIPGQIKICKNAGAGIAQGEIFNFLVTGTPVNPLTGGAIAGVGTVGAVTAGLTTENVQVPAGFCVFSQNRFQSGSTVGIQEVLTADQIARGIRLASVNVQSGAGTTTTFANNGTTGGTGTTIAAGGTIGTAFPNLVGGAAANITTAAGTNVNVTARTEVVVVTFNNFVFQASALKICKIAGTNVAVGTPFTFTVTGDTQGGILAPTTQTVTVLAGPAAQGGFCTIVGGGFQGTVAGGFTSFDVGSNITITETQTAGFVVATGGIQSNVGFTTGTTPNLTTGTANITITNTIGTGATAVTNVGNINEVTFTNNVATTTPGLTPGTAAARFDFDGDKMADIAVFRPSNGAWYMQQSSKGFYAVQFGQAGDKTVSADYDGDGKEDVAVYRSGTWFMLRSTAGFTSAQFGAANDIAAPADTDGDGRAELTVYRPSNGTWYSLNLATSDFKAVQFGTAGDIPVAADYDGDRRTDYAVYRPSNGVWYMLQSSKGFGAIQFGNATDKPVVADYDNDGKADQAVYRAGTWYVMNSSKGLSVAQFGNATDSPVPADYDGDGKTDFAVYRDENGAGMWYIMQSAGGSGVTNAPSAPTLRTIQFGSATDTPIPMP